MIALTKITSFGFLIELEAKKSKRSIRILLKPKQTEVVLRPCHQMN
jgi:hypothetical protein